VAGSGNIGYSTLTVMPSTRGFGAALSRDVNPQMHGSGLSAGKVMGAGLLAGFVAISAGIGAVIKTGFDEAKDASAGSAQLAAGIKSTGNAANVSLKGMNDLASSIQGYSGQTDDSIVASQQLLLTFTKIKNTDTDKIFDRATTATANMAAKMGGDAAGSAIQLGKALNDPVKGVASLGRMGVQFSDDQKKMIKSLVDTGDVAGAQNVILAELETQFGGAAEAAGNSLPGQLAKAKRSFEDVSQAVVEGLLPVVLPGLTSIGTTITDKVIPAVVGFIQGFKDGEGPGGKFRDILSAVNEHGIKPIGDFLVNTAIPAVQDFVQEFKDGEGPGGKLRDILVAVRDDGIKPLATFITGTGLPAIASIASWITDTGIPALSKFKGWIEDNKTALEVFGVFITVVTLPIFADMAAKAVASAITQVGAWVSVKVEGIISAASQVASHYVAVGGWVVSAAAAVTNGAITVAIWAMIKWDSIVGAAASVAAMITMDVQWVISAGKAVIGGAAQAAAWVVAKVEAGISALASVVAMLTMDTQWGVSALAASGSATAISGSWAGLATSSTVSAATTNTAISSIGTGASGVASVFMSTVGVFALGVWHLVSTWETTKQTLANLWGAMQSGWNSFSGMVKSWDWTKSIPTDTDLEWWRIKAYNSIYNAGASIISGLWDGMKAGWTAVADWVSSRGQWIADHKGPISYDKTLLIPAGNAIMDGLNKGLTTGLGKVKSTISGMNGEMAGLISVPTVASPDFGSAAYAGGANGRSSAGAPQVIVNPSVGLSEEQIGQAAAKQLGYALRR